MIKYYQLVAKESLSDIATMAENGPDTEQVERLRWRTTVTYARLIVLGPLMVALLLGFVLAFSQGCNCSGEKGSFLEQNLEIAIVCLPVMVVFIVSSRAYIAWKIREVPDPLGVNKETLLASLSSPIVGMGVTLAATDTGGYLSMSDAPWNWAWLIDIGCLLHFFVLGQLPVILSFRRQELTSAAEAQFDKLFTSERGIKSLSQFLATELSLENLLFLVRLREWRLNFASQSKREKEQSCEAIFHDFLKPNSTHELNISGHVR